MKRPLVSDEVRAILIWANGVLLAGGCGILLLRWYLALGDYPILRYANISIGPDNPPAGSLAAYGYIAFDTAQGNVAMAFPLLTGLAYAAAAIVSLRRVNSLLQSAPPRWLHALIALVVAWQAGQIIFVKGRDSLLLVDRWIIATLAADVTIVATLLFSGLRKYTWQIVGLSSGLDFFCMPGLSSCLIGGTLMLTVLVAFLDDRSQRHGKSCAAAGATALEPRIH